MLTTWNDSRAFASSTDPSRVKTTMHPLPHDHSIQSWGCGREAAEIGRPDHPVREHDGGGLVRGLDDQLRVELHVLDARVPPRQAGWRLAPPLGDEPGALQLPHGAGHRQQLDAVPVSLVPFVQARSFGRLVLAMRRLEQPAQQRRSGLQQGDPDQLSAGSARSTPRNGCVRK